MIAAIRQTGDQIEEYGELRLVSASSGLVRRFNPGGRWELGRWSPNEDRIAAIRATSASGGNLSVVIVSVRGGKLSVLKGAEPEAVQWAPEGEQIAVVRYLRETGPQGGEFEDELTVVDAATGAERVLRVGQPKGALMWHPGAEKLLFTEWVGGHEPGVWEADLKSGRQRLIVKEAESGQYCTMPLAPWSRAKGQRGQLLVRRNILGAEWPWHR